MPIPSVSLTNTKTSKLQPRIRAHDISQQWFPSKTVLLKQTCVMMCRGVLTGQNLIHMCTQASNMTQPSVHDRLIACLLMSRIPRQRLRNQDNKCTVRCCAMSHQQDKAWAASASRRAVPPIVLQTKITCAYPHSTLCKQHHERPSFKSVAWGWSDLNILLLHLHVWEVCQ